MTKKTFNNPGRYTMALTGFQSKSSKDEESRQTPSSGGEESFSELADNLPEYSKRNIMNASTPNGSSTLSPQSPNSPLSSPTKSNTSRSNGNSIGGGIIRTPPVKQSILDQVYGDNANNSNNANNGSIMEREEGSRGIRIQLLKDDSGYHQDDRIAFKREGTEMSTLELERIDEINSINSRSITISPSLNNNSNITPLEDGRGGGIFNSNDSNNSIVSSPNDQYHSSYNGHYIQNSNVNYEYSSIKNSSINDHGIINNTGGRYVIPSAPLEDYQKENLKRKSQSSKSSQFPSFAFGQSKSSPSFNKWKDELKRRKDLLCQSCSRRMVIFSLLTIIILIIGIILMAIFIPFNPSFKPLPLSQEERLEQRSMSITEDNLLHLELDSNLRGIITNRNFIFGITIENMEIKVNWLKNDKKNKNKNDNQKERQDKQHAKSKNSKKIDNKKKNEIKNENKKEELIFGRGEHGNLDLKIRPRTDLGVIIPIKIDHKGSLPNDPIWMDYLQKCLISPSSSSSNDSIERGKNDKKSKGKMTKNKKKSLKEKTIEYEYIVTITYKTPIYGNRKGKSRSRQVMECPIPESEVREILDSTGIKIEEHDLSS